MADNDKEAKKEIYELTKNVIERNKFMGKNKRNWAEAIISSMLILLIVIAIPFTPKFNEHFNVDTKNVSKITHNTSLTPVKAYTCLSLPNVTSVTKANCDNIANTFATLSILIYVAEASIISGDVAISFNNGLAHVIVTSVNTKYTPNVMINPVFNLLVNSFLSKNTLPTK